MSAPGRLSTVSVIVPAYNEEATVAQVVRNIRSRQSLPVELIVVNDGSSDGTREALASVSSLIDITINLEVNGGRGAAVRRGVEAASGDIIVFHDADLELDSAIVPELVAPIQDGRVDVVLGTRMHAGNRPLMQRRQWVANRIITGVGRWAFGVALTDIETAAKAIPRHYFPLLELECDGFELEPELIAKLAKLGARFDEVAITFQPRSKAEGKKIRAMDGPVALRTIMRYRHWRPSVRIGSTLGTPSPQAAFARS